MARSLFKVLVDENMSRAITNQLIQKGVHAVQVQDILPPSTKDPELLEYAYQHGYSLATHDERITEHITERQNANKEHCGIFIAVNRLQGPSGIGKIVEEIVFYDEAIKGGAATLGDSVYNQLIYI
jgi:predicted nuclease of predicted toxin-antitoxin system